MGLHIERATADASEMGTGYCGRGRPVRVCLGPRHYRGIRAEGFWSKLMTNVILFFVLYITLMVLIVTHHVVVVS